jgi:two-component system chemotaxis response regulator CheY
MTILIALIDDDLSFQFVSKKFLKASGHPHRLLQFHDGLEAINYFEAHYKSPEELPDLIFLDINMPYLDGWQFLDRLTALGVPGKSMTIYIVTSSLSPVDMDKAATYKMLSGYEVKPITKEKINEIIEKSLSELDGE